MIELKDYYKTQAETQPVATLQITNIPVKAKSRKTKIVALAAAVIILLSGVTAVAYRSEIAERVRITFGNSTAWQLRPEVVEGSPRPRLAHSVRGIIVEYFGVPDGYAIFYTLEEARAAVPFDFKLPDLPAYLEFYRATTMHDKEGTYLYKINLIFSEYGVPFNFSNPASMYIWPEWDLFIAQWRVGPYAYLRVAAAGEIETVMVGEIEALGIIRNGNLVELMFIEDGTKYHLSGRLKPGDLLAVAESLFA